MGTPNPCPPFCDERSWKMANQIQSILDQLIFEARQPGGNPNMVETFGHLEAAINILRAPVEKGETHGSSD